MCCAWFPDSQRFVSGSVDRTLALLDTSGMQTQQAGACVLEALHVQWHGLQACYPCSMHASLGARTQVVSSSASDGRTAFKTSQSTLQAQNSS